MTMNITSKQMEITPAIRQHVADRLAKLDKWQTHLINPHIILSKAQNKGKLVVSITAYDDSGDTATSYITLNN